MSVEQDFEDNEELLEQEDGEDEQEEQAQVVQAVHAKPELPAILWYHSNSHGVDRFYVNATQSLKPTWTTNKEEAFVFTSDDHLSLAYRHCRVMGYRQLQFETIK